ncbi:MAG TPA: type II toxin-antitoxin system HicB family antitoxin, partial [Polyangiaceae bacterium]
AARHRARARTLPRKGVAHVNPQKKYTISYALDAGNGWWTAELAGVPGCITQGRTIEQARERMREAIQAWFDLSRPFDGALVDDVRLPAQARAIVQKVRVAKEQAEDAIEVLSESSRRAVKTLTGLGMSLRDAGTLLGLSRQRAQQ